MNPPCDDRHPRYDEHSHAGPVRGRHCDPDLGQQSSGIAGAALFGDLDRDALAAIGIDVNAVRASIEASFGPEALTSASQALHREPRVRRLDPRRVSGAERDGVFLPHSRGVEQSLHNARVAAQARHDTQISVEHLALGLLAASEGPVPSILPVLAVSAAQLRAAILDRYRQAS